MPFFEKYIEVTYGLVWWNTLTYCQTNPSASDYGKCYISASGIGKPYYAYSATTPACISDNTCTGIPNPSWDYTITIKDNTSVNKQMVVYKFWTVSNSNGNNSADRNRCGRATIKLNVMGENLWPGFMFRTVNIVSGAGLNAYNPLDNSICAPNVFNTPTVGTQMVSEWSGAVLGMKIILDINLRNQSDVYYAIWAAAFFSEESSPLAIIPLDYDREYIPYIELKNVIGYSVDAINQPGWNANDIIGVLKELFPDRAWAVFDDRTYTLYLYNLTPDYVPDWLVEKLAPISMKVLKPPSDSSVAEAWLDELNRRNAYNPPPSVEV